MRESKQAKKGILAIPTVFPSLTHFRNDTILEEKKSGAQSPIKYTSEWEGETIDNKTTLE